MIAVAERLSPRQLGWLLAALAMVVAPHVAHLPWWCTMLTVMLFVWRIYVMLYSLTLPRKWLLYVMAAGTLVGLYIQYGRVLGRESGVTLLLIMLALKLMELATLRDAMVLSFIAYFLVITHFLYSQSIPTALYLLAAVCIITAAVVGLHYRVSQPGYREQLQTAATMLVQAAPMMLVLFVLFPRVQGPLWGLPQDSLAGATGLSDQMSPGSVSRLIMSDAIAFRANFDGQIPPPKQLYWRGPVMWDFDGATWTVPRVPYTIKRNYIALGEPVDYSVTVEPHGKRWLFALDLPGKTPPRAIMTTDYQLFYPDDVNSRLRYDMRSYLSYRDNAEATRYELQRALRLPHNANPRSIELARSMRSRAGDDRAYIMAVLAMYRDKDFYYTTTPPALGENPVDQFLFETRAGFCEHFASSFAVLMRAAGIPARIVTGYQGGEVNAVANYLIVRQADAHAWVEVWLPDDGWIRADPTAAVSPARVEAGVAAAVPAGEVLPFILRGDYPLLRKMRLAWDSVANSWNEMVLGYSPERQRRLLRHVGIDDATWRSMTVIMFSITGAITLILALMMLKKLHAARPDPVVAAYQRFCKTLARSGVPRHASEGPDAFRKRAIAMRPELATAIGTITDLYIRLRYGDEDSQAMIEQLTYAVKGFRP